MAAMPIKCFCSSGENYEVFCEVGHLELELIRQGSISTLTGLVFLPMLLSLVPTGDLPGLTFSG